MVVGLHNNAYALNNNKKKEEHMHRIVIVGGGAGGLELATRLGDRYGPRKGRPGEPSITLIDKNRTHIWKPKLHEIAAGSMDLGDHEVDYIAQAHWHHCNPPPHLFSSTINPSIPVIWEIIATNSSE